jgi:signal recognition particle receptor subunit beta
MTSKAEFFNLLINHELRNASILILANKQDLPSAKSASEINDIYSLDEI